MKRYLIFLIFLLFLSCENIYNEFYITNNREDIISDIALINKSDEQIAFGIATELQPGSSALLISEYWFYNDLVLKYTDADGVDHIYLKQVSEYCHQTNINLSQSDILYNEYFIKYDPRLIGIWTTTTTTAEYQTIEFFEDNTVSLDGLIVTFSNRIDGDSGLFTFSHLPYNGFHYSFFGSDDILLFNGETYYRQ